MAAVTTCTSADGVAVVEVELPPGRTDDLATVVELARSRSAGLVWAYTPDDLEAHGFAETPGFTRLEGSPVFDEPLAGDEEVVLLADEALVRRLRRECFVDRFGHKEPAADRPVTRPGQVHLGLVVAGEVVGTCRVEPAHRYVDGPGILPGHRTPLRYLRLLRAAVELAGPTGVVVECWGEAAEVMATYARTGLRVVAHVPGWQRRP